MFDRFSEDARRVIFFARYEASKFGSPAIDSEHILLGVMHLYSELLLVPGRDISLPTVRDLVQKRVPSRGEIPTHVELPFSTSVQEVLRCAVREAERSRQSDITPKHLLLGLMKQPDCMAQNILKEMGVKLKNIRDWTQDASGGPSNLEGLL